MNPPRLNPEHLPGIYGAATLAERPSLFSAVCLPVPAADLRRMAAVAAAMERVAASPAYRRAVFGEAAASLVPTASGGVCMGYDFHLTADGPKLIEINTNAGGLALVADLFDAWQLDGAAVRRAALAMFRAEWVAARGEVSPLRNIALVDETPESQFLYPEFERFRRWFEDDGLAADIAAPEQLEWDGAALRLRGKVVDFVYNRLTDFALSGTGSAALFAAWRAGAVVVSPNPQAHRLYADKHNLERLADPAFRGALGLADDDEAALADAWLPMRPVRAADAEVLWKERKQWFFKPAAGFGSKAVYRGDKITRRVFDEVLAGDYVAQALAPPAEIDIEGPSGEVTLKYDVRNYTHRGRVLAVAARLFQGQTTNFRTPGGGFAPVLAA